MKTVTVNADALRQVLQALNGPSHHIAELQSTRNPIFKDNPINILIDEFNAAIQSTKPSTDTEHKEGAE